MLGFWDIEKIKGIPNKNSPLIIIVIVGKFHVSQILKNDDSSSYIMYSKLSEKMGLNQSGFWPYKGSNLQALNRTTTRPWGYMDLIVSILNGNNIWAVNS